MNEEQKETPRQRTLIVVEAPFQLLCAYEWICETRSPYELIIRLGGGSGNDAQLRAMAEDLGVTVTKWLYLEPRVDLRYVLGLRGLFRFLFRSYERVVVGSFFSGFQRLIRKITRARDVVLLDDGVATLLQEKVAAATPTKYSAFTIFRLDPANYRTYVHNTFQHLLSTVTAEGMNEGRVYFVGQKLVDIGALSLERYIDLLRLCVRENPGVTVHYIPHRGESEMVLEAIRKEPGVALLKIDWTIEYYMVRNHIRPARIYSVVSTALYTLATMFPSCDATSFDPEGLRREMFVHYGLIHDAFRTLPNLSIRAA